MKGILIAGALVIAALASPACGAAGSHGPAAATRPSGAQAVRAWVAAGGKARLSLVNADLDVIARHATTQQAASLVTDGAQLAKDATAAEAIPLPCAVADYVAAMRALASAGADLALGHVAQATTEIRASDAPLSRAISAYNKAVGS